MGSGGDDAGNTDGSGTGPGPGNNPDTCVDNDGDGYGKNCQAGPDCDDANPNFAVVCPNCAKNSFPGCPCSVAAQNCYSGDPVWIGKGECTAGVQLCQNGFWGSCQSEVLPTPEACDGKDNNCNGLIDEGVLSSCGTCDLACTSQQTGPDYGNPFSPGGDNSQGVTLDQNGYLVLSDKSKEIDLNHIWIANSAEGTVSKLNTKSGKEIARYAPCADPSRTAVDLNGDVWVGCRAGAAVAKIVTDTSKCVDKNNNGKIDTSFDADNNGVISKSELLPTGTDECVKFVVKPPGVKLVRAVGVDKENHGWIGDWYGKVLWRLHPETGAVVDTYNIGCNPYGITIDQKGTVWVAGRGCAALISVDPKTKQVQSYKASAKYNPYGINVDIYGKIWVGNCCSHHAGYRFDPLTGTFASVNTGSRPRGVATSIEGYVFVANDQSNSVAKINAKTLKNEGQISLGSGRFPIGMAIDYDGFVWAVNQQKGSATKIDPKTMQVIGEYPVGKGPYTYSDMTGYTLHHFTAPRGNYTTVFGFVHAGGTVNEYTQNEVEWESIHVDAIVPPEGYVKVRYRVANTLKLLETAAWSEELGPYPPLLFPLQLGAGGKKVIGRFLQVDVILQAGTDKKSPVVKSIKANGKQLGI
jgi:YVTN family beta-propeller protein